MGAEAAFLALEDTGITPERVEIAFFANGLGSRLFGDSTIGQNVLWEAGVNRIPVVNVENACTSGSTAFYLACNAVAAGQGGDSPGGGRGEDVRARVRPDSTRAKANGTPSSAWWPRPASPSGPSGTWSSTAPAKSSWPRWR